ncbi:polysaccharide deacetylase family protein, PEP-CTERM locus subfamily [Desulfacinum infernum DSM 9756]|uniref:Polysaccharide deacetylase family protein, PEP-CTERM locus subfamily n=1 Tax=Desulfacinum infernum DSM 9756 TaxID=1121391 RepID=A0A1M5GIA6_9BACT|nr:polysaccharide deacetylase family protein, PEP-CTERM locus subfamily [Desulfacinum infernum DSM 9756]
MVLTFDVEDWFQVENLRAVFPPDTWDGCELRVEGATRRLLDLLDRLRDGREDGAARDVRATFFVLGWVAEKVPHLVREIRDRGHEVASHGHGHLLCRNMTPDSLRDDIRRSKAVLEDILGEPVVGYRAPGFSVSPQLLEILAEEGFCYDSSYNSFGANPRHGRLDPAALRKRRGVYETPGRLVEIPVSNLHLNGGALPWAGGGYFRLLCLKLFAAGARAILDREGLYVFYLHPWELDPDQPRVGGLGPLGRFRHYVNLEKTEKKLENFAGTLEPCRFLSCSDYLENVLGRSKSPPPHAED